MKENTLYSYWEEKVMEDGPFQTSQGETLKVISPGRRNTGSGPDYHGCILDVDGEIHTGEVEIHVSERDWYRHGHADDSSFNGVKLHFFLVPDSERIAPGQIQRTVQLGEGADSDTSGATEEERFSTYTTRCPAGHKLDQSPGRTGHVLRTIEQLGRKRIQRRVKFLAKRIGNCNSRLTVLARVLCESVCLRRNQSPARTVGEHVAFHALKRRLQEVQNAARAQIIGEGVLLEHSGLLEEASRTVSESEWVVYRSKMDSVDVSDRAFTDSSAWNCTDVRPVNTPYRRLAGFVALFRRLLVDFTIDQLESVLLDQVDRVQIPDDVMDVRRRTDLLSFLTMKPDQVRSYWNQHSGPGDAFDRPMSLIGPHRAAIVWVNGLLPYLFAIARRRNYPGVTDKLWALCRTGALPLEDHRSKRVANQLFGPESTIVPGTALIDQGQHELFRSFCRFGPNGCSRCPVHKTLGGPTEACDSS